MIKLGLIILFIAVALPAADFRIIEKQVGSAKLTFVRNLQAEKDHKGEEKFFHAKAGFSAVENLAPLSKASIGSLNGDSLKTLTAEEFNQLYARLQSGPLLAGDFKVSVLQKSAVFVTVKKKLLKNFRLDSAAALAVNTLCGGNEDCLVEMLWKGKRFLPKNSFGQVEALSLLQLPIGAATLFPMNTYCGISQIDARRESQIVDGNFSDDFSDYVSVRDELVTRKQLSITEEYRMVRPGLYIGKIYSNKVFLFNVSLEKTGSPSVESANACFDGSKTR